MKGKNIRVTKAIDMWSLGIIIHELGVAYKPTCYRDFKYGVGPIPFNKREFKKFVNNGAQVQDLIEKCLIINPKERITTE